MAAERRVIGATVVDVAKFVVKLEKLHGHLGLSAETQAIVRGRVNLTTWYHLSTFQDLLRAVDRAVRRARATSPTR